MGRPRHVPLLGVLFLFSFARGRPRSLLKMSIFIIFVGAVCANTPLSCLCTASCTASCRASLHCVYRRPGGPLPPSRRPIRCDNTPTACCRNVGPFGVDLHGQQCGALVFALRSLHRSPSAKSIGRQYDIFRWWNV